jgi:phage terminase Nu1 subunit (DNA packaging protein)
MTVTKKLTWPSEKMAKLIDLTPRRLRQLVDEGVVPREERGRYNPFVVTVAYIRYLRDRAQSPEASDSEFFAAKLAKIRAEHQQIVLDMEIKRGARIPIQDVNEISKHIFAHVRGVVIASKLSAEEKNEILDRLRDLPWLDGPQSEDQKCDPVLWQT